MASSISFVGPGNAEPMQALTEFIRSTLPGQTEEAMLYTGGRQITRIKTRTQAGRDVNGEPFKEYSPAYAKVRAKAGRNTSPVDLTFSGRALNSLRVDVVASNQFAITVGDPEAAVYMQAHNEGLGHMPERRFFDTSQEELNAMGEDLREFEAMAQSE